MELEDFEKLVGEAISNLPSKFKEKIDNVEVVVETWPNNEYAKGRLLLGLYQGVPKTVWGRGLATRIPDKITIFKGPIEWLARGEIERIKQLVVDTVEHEIAHHFGISDARLDEIDR